MKDLRSERRVVVWFSCGAASATAGKLALEKYKKTHKVIMACCVIKNEHPDNERFLKDCEKWYGQEILKLKSEKYEDCWDVWEKTKFLVGPYGARCTTEMKKLVRQKFQKISDIQVFGFTSEEAHRADRFREQNPEVDLETPLITESYDKERCFQTLRDAGIEIPAMYKLGYKNNNCVGCPKGGAKYWSSVRRDFPEVFAKMVELEKKLNVKILKIKGKRIFLDELAPNYRSNEPEPDMQCGLWCADEEKENG